MTLPVEIVKRRARPTTSYSPSQITLYGTNLNSLDAWLGPADDVGPVSISIDVQPGTVVTTTATQSGPKTGAATDKYNAALIIAFAYQGHCYNLPEPMIVIVEGNGTNAYGFDFDGTGYLMWPVEKLDRTMLLEPTSDTFEELILKRYLAGAKQPMAYASRAMISHRGGKLSE